MPQFGKKTFPLGWIPSDDEHNGRYDGLLLMENCHLSDIGIVRSFRGGRIVSDRMMTNPVNLYSKVINQTATDTPNCKVGELDEDNPLYPAIQQAWAFGEGAGNITKESKHGYIANINLDGARWVTDEGECSTLEINGGYAYPASPPALTPMPNGKLNLTEPYPTIEQPVIGPTNHIEMNGISIVVKFRAYDFNNYNKANLSIFTKGNGDPDWDLAAKLWFLQQPFDDPPIGGSVDRHEPWMTFGRYCGYEPGDWTDLQEAGFDRNSASNTLICLDGEWHTLIIVSGPKGDPTGSSWHFYVDGTEMPNNLYGGYISEFEDFYSNEGMSLAIGSTVAGDWDWYPGHALWGQISTLQFYNRPLTPTEVSLLTLDPLRIWLPAETRVSTRAPKSGDDFVKLRYIHEMPYGVTRNYGPANSLTTYDQPITTVVNYGKSGFLSALGHTFVTHGNQKKKDNYTIVEDLGIIKAAAPTIVTANDRVVIVADRFDGEGYGWWDADMLFGVSGAGSSYRQDEVVGGTGKKDASNDAVYGVIQAGAATPFTQDFTDFGFGGGTGHDSEFDPFEIQLLCDDVRQLKSIKIFYYLQPPPALITDLPPVDYYFHQWDAEEIIANVTTNTWGTLRATRGEFSRNGGDTNLSWTTVRGIRIVFTFIEDIAKTCFFSAGFFTKSTETTNGKYLYRQVNAEDTGYYLEQGIMSDDVYIETHNQTVNIQPSAVPAPANTALIYRFNIDVGEWYLIKKITSETKGFTPAPFVDNLTDEDAALQHDPLMPLEEYRSLLPNNIIDMIFFADRVIYLTAKGIYPSYKLDPGSYDTRFVYEFADAVNDFCFFIVKIDETRFFVGTSSDIYGVFGTFNLSTEPVLVQDLTITPLGIKFPPISRATFVENSNLYYLCRDGWRYLSGTTNEKITSQLDLVYNEYRRYTVGPNIVTLHDTPIQSCAFARQMNFFTYEDAVGTRYVFALNKELKYWTLIRGGDNDRTPYILYAEEDNTLLCVGKNFYIYEFDEVEGAPVDVNIVSPRYDLNAPFQRKDIAGIQFWVDTGGAPMTLKINELPQIINCNGRTLITTSVAGPQNYIQWQMIGLVPTFKFYGFEISYDVRPPQATFRHFEGTNFGDPRKKKVRNIPIKIDTMGNDVLATFTKDCVLLNNQVINTSCSRTVYLTPTCTSFGVDYSVNLSGGPFEFYEMYPPSVVETLPLEKICDQIGPLEGYKFGDVKSVKLRLLPSAPVINWAVYNHDIMIESGFNFPVAPNEHNWYEIIFKQDLSAYEVIRFEFSAATPFHRTAAWFKVRMVGNETEFKYVEWPSQ